MRGLLYALVSVATLLLMCDRRDLGTAIGERPPSPGLDLDWEEAPSRIDVARRRARILRAESRISMTRIPAASAFPSRCSCVRRSSARADARIDCGLPLRERLPVLRRSGRRTGERTKEAALAILEPARLHACGTRCLAMTSIPRTASPSFGPDADTTCETLPTGGSAREPGDRLAQRLAPRPAAIATANIWWRGNGMPPGDVHARPRVLRLLLPAGKRVPPRDANARSEASTRLSGFSSTPKPPASPEAPAPTPF